MSDVHDQVTPEPLDPTPGVPEQLSPAPIGPARDLPFEQHVHDQLSPAPAEQPVSFVGLLQPPDPEPARRSVLRPVVAVGVLAAVVVSAWFGFGGGRDAPGGDPDSYAFMVLQADGVTPATFDPCVPIHYVTRPDNEPENGQRLIAEAVDRISAATGLTFVDDGRPDPSAVDEWGPVLISWETSSENPELEGDTVGLGGPSSVVLADGTRVLVTGTVSLEAAELESMRSIWGGQDAARAVVMHELAHVVGLDHVDDSSQIMSPTTSRSVTEFGAGDLAGLKRLGQGVCIGDVG